MLLKKMLSEKNNLTFYASYVSDSQIMVLLAVPGLLADVTWVN